MNEPRNKEIPLKLKATIFLVATVSLANIQHIYSCFLLSNNSWTSALLTLAVEITVVLMAFVNLEYKNRTFKSILIYLVSLQVYCNSLKKPQIFETIGMSTQDTKFVAFLLSCAMPIIVCFLIMEIAKLYKVKNIAKEPEQAKEGVLQKDNIPRQQPQKSGTELTIDNKFGISGTTLEGEISQNNTRVSQEDLQESFDLQKKGFSRTGLANVFETRPDVITRKLQILLANNIIKNNGSENTFVICNLQKGIEICKSKRRM